MSLLGASFVGGITGYFAARGPEQLSRLVMINPLLNYKKRFVDDKPYWSDDHINDDAARELVDQAAAPHCVVIATMSIKSALLNCNL